jgi:hypothetical protein
VPDPVPSRNSVELRAEIELLRKESQRLRELSDLLSRKAEDFVKLLEKDKPRE